MAPLFVALMVFSGCVTGTRTGGLGVLPHGERLVTLIVSDDPTVVRGECLPGFTPGAVLGCQTSRRIHLTEGRSVRVVTIVRYTDRLPSALAFEIDIHELCHAVAALQAIDDPCHLGNDGISEHAAVQRHLLSR